MKHLLLTLDLEEFVCPAEIGMKIKKERLFEVSREGLKNVMPIIDKHNIKATFFTTYEFALLNKDILSKLVSKGHEIALHGLYHNTSINNMNEKALFNELHKAKSRTEKLLNIKIKGFRSPQMRKVKYGVLESIGILYDSSMHPTFVPGNNNLFKTRNIHKVKNITVIPVSVTPIFRLPFSWVWFRNLGLFYSKICTRFCLIDKDYINIYFHPWDFYNTNTSEFRGVRYVSLRNAGDKAVRKLEEYCKWCNKIGLQSSTISEYLSEKRFIKIR